MLVFIIVMGMAALLALLGLVFYCTKSPEKTVLYLTGDYSGLNATKVCRTAGRRMLWWAIALVPCAVVGFWSMKWSVYLAVGILLVCVIYHALDFSQNRDRYRE
ncbi:MAG: hypothetical protein U0M59_02075 [Angelakisella sp.]|nr:hypothetical protein [Clostridiales bacterium]